MSDDVQCPHCGAVEDHVFDDISEADIGRPVTLIGPCWKCDQPYATEVRIEVYVRELTADELTADELTADELTADELTAEAEPVA